MTTDLARVQAVALDHEQPGMAELAHVIGTHDLYQLSNTARVDFYVRLCQDCGLKVRTRPFQWIEFKQPDGKPVLTLYLKPEGAAQILRNNHVSVFYPKKEIVGELFKVEAHGRCPDGREGSATKYVPLTNRFGRLAARDLANAYMSAETGALRRLAIAMFGISGGGPDVTDVAGWRPVIIDGTGAVVEHPTDEQRMLAETRGVASAVGEPTFEEREAALGPAGPEGSRDDGGATLGPRAEELEHPKQVRPRPTFRPTKEQVDAWQRAWFATVKGSSLDSDDARHRYVGQWTATEGWPAAKQTESLVTMFGRMTEREAEDFLGHTRALVEDEKRANEEALAEARGEGSPREAGEEDAF